MKPSLIPSKTNPELISMEKIFLLAYGFSNITLIMLPKLKIHTIVMTHTQNRNCSQKAPLIFKTHTLLTSQRGHKCIHTLENILTHNPYNKPLSK